MSMEFVDAGGSANGTVTDLDCAVCRNRLKAPIFLDCLHSMCQRHTHETASDLACGICQTKIVLSKERAWVRDLISEHLLEQMSSEKAQATCENCENAIPVWFCNTCSSALCQLCYTSVHSAPIFRKHQLVTFSEREVPTRRWECELHAKPVEFFNQDTQRPACVGCLLGGALSPRRTSNVGDEKKRVGRSRSAQSDEPMLSLSGPTVIPEKFLPIVEATKQATSELSTVLTQSNHLIQTLTMGQKALQALVPQLAENFDQLEKRIQSTFKTFHVELEQQENEYHRKATQLRELKERALKNRQLLVSSRLHNLEMLHLLLTRMLSLRDADIVLLSLKEFIFHQFTDTVSGLMGSSVKAASLTTLKVPMDVTSMISPPAVQFDWVDIQSPAIVLQNQLAQANTRNEALRKRLSSVYKELNQKRNQTLQLQQDIAALRQSWQNEVGSVTSWCKNQLQLLLQHQGSRSFPRWQAKRALASMDEKPSSSTAATSDAARAAAAGGDLEKVTVPFHFDLDAWAELRLEQSNLVSSLGKNTARLEQLQTAVQEFNRDVTIRRCRPSSSAVMSVVTAVRALKTQVTAARDDFNSVSPQLKNLWKDLRTAITREEVALKTQSKQLEDVENDYHTLAEGVEQIQQVYELLSKKTHGGVDVNAGTQGYLEQIKDVKPDSGKRLQALQTAGFEREKERSKIGNQMEAGLRDGLRMLRHTGGLEKMEAMRKTRSEEMLATTE